MIKKGFYIVGIFRGMEYLNNDGYHILAELEVTIISNQKPQLYENRFRSSRTR